MKKGNIIIGVLVGVLIVLLILNMVSEQGGGEGVLRVVMDKSLEWLYSDKALGIGYGECVFDSDCGDTIKGDKKCGGNNIVQEVNEKKCEEGMCAERVFSDVVERAGECFICDDSSGKPEFIPAEKGSPCIDKLGNKGFCFDGSCEKDDCNSKKYLELLEGKGSCFTCDDSSGELRFKSKENGESCNDEDGKEGVCLGGECKSVNVCGRSYCVNGEGCCGGGTSFPLCCDTKTEFCDSKIDLVNLQHIDKRLTEAKIPRWKALKVEELSKKYGLNDLSKDTMAKLLKLRSKKDMLIELIKNGELINFYRELAKSGIGIEEYPHMLNGLNFLKEVEKESISDGELNTILNIYTEEAGNPEAKSYFCQKKEDECEKDGKHKLCLGSHGSACCPISGPGSTCVRYTSRMYDLRNSFVDLLREMFRKDSPPEYNPEVAIYSCGDPNPVSEEMKREMSQEQIEQMKKSWCLSQGKAYCPDNNFGKLDGIICYDESKEECVTGNIYGSPTAIIGSFYPPFKQPKNCRGGFTECSATIPLSGGQVHRLCCNNEFEDCLKRIDSYIRCVPKDKRVGNPSLTKSTSVYMIRNENEFGLDGMAYVIEPSVNFKKEVIVTLESEIREGEDVFKYDNHNAVLENCEAKKLKSITHGVGFNGGSIGLEGEISVKIPVEALDNSFDFTITSYDLSNCYEVGKKIYVGYANDRNGFEETPSKTDSLNFRVIGIIIGIIILILIILFRKKLF